MTGPPLPRSSASSYGSTSARGRAAPARRSDSGAERRRGRSIPSRAAVFNTESAGSRARGPSMAPSTLSRSTVRAQAKKSPTSIGETPPITGVHQSRRSTDHGDPPPSTECHDRAAGIILAWSCVVSAGLSHGQHVRGRDAGALVPLGSATLVQRRDSHQAGGVGRSECGALSMTLLQHRGRRSRFPLARQQLVNRLGSGAPAALGTAGPPFCFLLDRMGWNSTPTRVFANIGKISLIRQPTSAINEMGVAIIGG